MLYLGFSVFSRFPLGNLKPVSSFLDRQHLTAEALLFHLFMSPDFDKFIV